MTEQELRQLLAEEYDAAIAQVIKELKLDRPTTKKKLIAALLKANKLYWVRRLSQIDRYFTGEAEALSVALSVPYMAAEATFADRVRSIYANYESAFHLSKKDAKELLESVRYDRTIADSLRKIAEDMPQGEERDRILAEISAPAYRYRLERAETMCKQAEEVCEQIAGTETAVVREFLQTGTERAYNITVEGLNETTPAEKIIEDIRPAEPLPVPEALPAEVTVQPAEAAVHSMPRSETPITEFTPTPVTTGVYDSFSLISTKNVKEIVSRNWTGREFSSTIWKNKEELAQEIKKTLIEGELTGASEVDMAAKIAERFDVGMYEARRVIRTESNYCTNQATLKGFQDADIEEYEYGALIDDRTSDICQALDGKKFKVKDAVVGVNYPPMHPFCRSAVMAVLADEDELDAELHDMMREAGAPEGMTFDEFVEHLKPSEDGMHLEFKSYIPDGRTDVTDEYKSKATPGAGEFSYDKGCEDGTHDRELAFAEWIHNNLGGDLHVCEEINQDKVKNPDYLWNGKFWDLKTASTEKSANTAVQRGIDQIKGNPGGLMLDFGNRQVNLSTLEAVLDKRMNWYNDMTIDIMVVSNNEILKVYRYEK